MTAWLADPRKRFGVTVALLMIPLLVLWWWKADLLIGLLAGPTRVLLHLFGLGDFSLKGDGGWALHNNPPIMVVKPDGAEVAVITLGADSLRRLALSFPIFMALCLTPLWPRRPWIMAVVGLLILALIFSLSAIAEIAFYPVAVANKLPWPGTATSLPANLHVDMAPAKGLKLLVPSLSYYLAPNVLPILGPFVTWFALNKPARSLLLRLPEAPEEAEAEVKAETETQPEA